MVLQFLLAVLLVIVTVAIALWSLRPPAKPPPPKVSEQELAERLAAVKAAEEKLAKLAEQNQTLEVAVGAKNEQIKGIAALIEKEFEAQRNLIQSELAAKQAEIKGVAALVQKEFEVQREKQRLEYEQMLSLELQAREESHPLAAYKAQLETLTAEIQQAQMTMEALQKQALSEIEQEDFIRFHSIELSGGDMADVRLIREFQSQLSRQEAMSKLIWREIYQKPIQQLCKDLAVDDLTGIYKITNTRNGRMYIGQAVKIGTRWKDHCKSGLGIGTTSYLSNKFYKALYDEGIETFTFEVLEACLPSELNSREAYWIDFYNATSFGYNTKAGG